MSESLLSPIPSPSMSVVSVASESNRSVTSSTPSPSQSTTSSQPASSSASSTPSFSSSSSTPASHRPSLSKSVGTSLALKESVPQMPSSISENPSLSSSLSRVVP